MKLECEILNCSLLFFFEVVPEATAVSACVYLHSIIERSQILLVLCAAVLLN